MRMRRNGYSATSGQKSDPFIRSGDPISYKTAKFPLSDDVCGIYFMFLSMRGENMPKTRLRCRHTATILVFL